MRRCQQEVWVLSMQDIASECSAAGYAVSSAAMTAQLIHGNFETAVAACTLTSDLHSCLQRVFGKWMLQGSSYTLDSSKTDLQGNDIWPVQL